MAIDSSRRLFQNPIRVSTGYGGANAPSGLLDDRFGKIDSSARLDPPRADGADLEAASKAGFSPPAPGHPEEQHLTN